MLKFPIQTLMSYESCYNFLLNLLHPNGFCCSCGEFKPVSQKAHKYRKNKLPCFKCRVCGKVYNIFTGTILSGIHYDCITIVLLLRGFSQGVSSQHLSQELSISYDRVLTWRHIFQEYSFENRDICALKDNFVESDEVFQNAGEKGLIHANTDDPPRPRANKKKGSALIKMTVHPYKDFLAEKQKRFD